MVFSTMDCGRLSLVWQLINLLNRIWLISISLSVQPKFDVLNCRWKTMGPICKIRFQNMENFYFRFFFCSQNSRDINKYVHVYDFNVYVWKRKFRPLPSVGVCVCVFVWIGMVWKYVNPINNDFLSSVQILSNYVQGVSDC